MPFDTRKSSINSARMEYGNTGKEQKNQLTIDREMEKGTRIEAVWFDGRRSPFLASMHDGQVYIRGHGMPGENLIEGGHGGEKVRYDEVVSRLIKTGLSKTFSGKIKCYNCHSAETIGVEGNAWPQVIETGGLPFAQLIADAAYAAGYRSCTFYGYVGAIDSVPKDGSEGKHKYVRAKVMQNGKMVQVEMGRASESRFQFYPSPVPKKPGLFAKLFA